jgi:hypothetical protein
MSLSNDRDTQHLRRLDGFKRRDVPVAGALGETIGELFHREVERRHTKLADVADVWGRLVPERLQAHACLDGLVRGRLSVMIDSAPHLFELRQLFLAGLEVQLLHALRPTGVRKIQLKRGRWTDDTGHATY